MDPFREDGSALDEPLGPPTEPAAGATPTIHISTTSRIRPTWNLSNQSLAKWAAVAVAVTTITLLAITWLAHPVPLYDVETDLIGAYVPAARALASGRVALEHYQFKGPGYPLMLAIASRATHDDYFLAARIVSALAAGAAGAFAFLLVRLFAGTGIALFVLAGTLLNPVFVRYGIEAGTDAPALALMLAATWAALRARSARSMLLAGLLAGAAALTRGNAVFLIPAGAVLAASRAPRVRHASAFLAAASMPWLLWSAVCLAATGHLARDLNYQNVAYELYGRDLPWDRLGDGVGARFHSLIDVLAYDPGRAAARIAWNLVTHFASDLGQLLPIGLGILVPPGLILATRRREWRPALLYAASCAVTLAPVFYSPRFSLYLLPMALAAAAAMLAAIPLWCARREGASAVWTTATRRLVRVAACGALLACGVAAARDLRVHLAAAPLETRIAGEWLRAQGFAGQSLMARKPHAAYFAGMEYCPMPVAASMIDLIGAARAAHARYLFFSPIEAGQRPDFAVLGDSGVALPGLDPLRYAATGGDRYYAIYRVRDEPVDAEAMGRALDRALDRYARRRPGDPNAQILLALQLANAGRHHAALERLLELDRALVIARSGPRDVVAELLSNAYFELGEMEASRRACHHAMTMGRPAGWHFSRLGAIDEREGHLREAEVWYQRAARAEPANVEPLARLGFLSMRLARFDLAADAFQRCVRLAPRDARYRRLAMGALRYAGDERRARLVFDEGLRAGIAPAAMLEEDPDEAGVPAP